MLVTSANTMFSNDMYMMIQLSHIIVRIDSYVISVVFSSVGWCHYAYYTNLIYILYRFISN